jgi:hypothetical protein
VLLSACTKHNPGSTCQDGACIDPKFPFCDADGVIGGTANECIAVSCSAGEFGACAGDTALTCNQSGDNYDPSACAHGCSDATGGCSACTPSTVSCDGGSVVTCDANGTVVASEPCALTCIDGPPAHCAYLAPKYLPDVCDTPASTASLDITSSGSYDSLFDANCNGGVIQQSGGPSLCVFRYGTISIEAGATVTFNNNTQPIGRSIALVSDGDLRVNGSIDVGAKGVYDGPGGGYLTSGGGGSGNGQGGAGFKTVGGAGGSTTTDGGGNNGGAQTLDPATVAPLIGGPKSSGGGGGGITLISCRGQVNVGGMIAASGGGGIGGVILLGNPVPGGGGGAGGYVVLQGISVVVTGQLYANGGAGGAGTSSAATQQYDGNDGTWSDTTAAMGGSSPNGAGHGGNGAIVGTGFPGAGGHPTTSGASPGGGGGSMGFLQTYTATGVTPTLTPSHASPQLQPNGTLPTR